MEVLNTKDKFVRKFYSFCVFLTANVKCQKNSAGLFPFTDENSNRITLAFVCSRNEYGTEKPCTQIFSRQKSTPNFRGE